MNGICHAMVLSSTLLNLGGVCLAVWIQFYGLGGANADSYQGPLLLTWFNFNPSMDK